MKRFYGFLAVGDPTSEVSKTSEVGSAVAVALLLLARIPLPKSPRLRKWGAEDVARAGCVERGWREESLVYTGFTRTGGFLGLFGERETAFFHGTKGDAPPGRVRVDLRRPVFFLGWEVVSCAEESPQQGQ